MPLPKVPDGALERFRRAAEESEEQRKAILAAKNFRAGNQWPEEVRQQRQGAPAIQGVAAQPARPCLTVDRVSQPVRQVSNTVRQSNYEIKTLPNGDGADVGIHAALLDELGQLLQRVRLGADFVLGEAHGATGGTW